MNECCKEVRRAVDRDCAIRQEVAVGRARQDVQKPLAHYAEELRLCLDRKVPNIALALSFVERLKEIATDDWA